MQEFLSGIPVYKKQLFVSLLMTVFSQSLFSFMRRNLMTLSFFTTRHNSLMFFLIIYFFNSAIFVSMALDSGSLNNPKSLVYQLIASALFPNCSFKLATRKIASRFPGWMAATFLKRSIAFSV